MPGESLNVIAMASTQDNKVFGDFRTGEKVFIVNKSLVEVSLPEHTVVAGYPVKGAKFEKLDGEKAKVQQELDVLFHVQDMHQAVFFNNSVTTVLNMIEVKRKENPEQARVSYHVMKDDPLPQCPGAFTLEVKNKVYDRLPELTKTTVKSEDAAETAETVVNVTQASAASCIGQSKWKSGKLLKLMWVVRWAAKRIVPVSPKIVLAMPLTLAPDQAVCVV